MLVPVSAAVLQFPFASLMPGDKFCWARARLASRSDWNNSEWAALFLFQFSWKFTLFTCCESTNLWRKIPCVLTLPFPILVCSSRPFKSLGGEVKAGSFEFRSLFMQALPGHCFRAVLSPSLPWGVIPRVTFILVAQICLGPVSFRLRFFWLDIFYNYSR